MRIANGRAARWLAPLLLVPVAFLPDIGAALPVSTYYFRDVGQLFIPSRLYQGLELAAGRMPFWNPYVHEGELMLPSLYPLDLLHVLAPTPVFISWLLSLHLPIAALSAYALGRSRGMSRSAAFAAGSVYALGGFALSTLNLYHFLQALALAPLVLLALDRAAGRGGAWIAAAALVVAASVSTMGVELVVQAVVLGIVLAVWRDDPARRLASVTAAIALGAALAAIPISITLGALPETARGAGLPAAQSGNYPLPAIGLLQLLIPSLFGPLTQPFDIWWGRKFFAPGVPYFLSLYLGGLALSLALVGAWHAPRRERIVLLGAALIATWYALGPAGGLWSLLQALPGADAFRFPVKTMFVVHLAAALLAGRGIDRLRDGGGWRLLALAGAAAGMLAVAVGLGVGIAADALAAWLSPDPLVHDALVAQLPADAYRAAAVTLAGTLLAGMVILKRIGPGAGAALLIGLVVFDLTRAGSGINRQAHPSFFEVLPALAAEKLDRAEGGRLFSVPPASTYGFLVWLASSRSGADLWTYYATRQLFEPYFNLIDRIETAATPDRTGFAPRLSTLPIDDYDPKRLEAILPLLRHAAVDRISSLEALEHPQVRLRRTLPIAGSGLSLHLYELLDAWPKAFIACRAWFAGTRVRAAQLPHAAGFDPRRDVVFEAEQASAPRNSGCTAGSVTMLPGHPGEERFVTQSDGDGWLVVRATHARGWTARLDGGDVELRRADGRHRAVRVPPGRHEVVMRYEPPGLRAGLALTAAAALLLTIVLARAALPLPG